MGAPWKCLKCDARWYAMGPPAGHCHDCGSEDIDVDTDPVLTCKLCGVTLFDSDTEPCGDSPECPVGRV